MEEREEEVIDIEKVVKDIKEYLNNNVQYDAGLFSKKVNELNPQIKINFYNEIISWKKEKRK